AVLAAVEDLIGPDLLFYHLTMWIKEPGDDAFVSWHQDGTYFGLDPADQHAAAWVALTDSLPEMGCVTVLPGSHRLGQLRHSIHRATARRRRLRWTRRAWYRSCCGRENSRCTTRTSCTARRPTAAAIAASAWASATSPRGCATSDHVASPRRWCEARTVTGTSTPSRARGPTSTRRRGRRTQRPARGSSAAGSVRTEVAEA